MRRILTAAAFLLLAPWLRFLDAQGRVIPEPCFRTCPPGRVCPPCGPVHPTIVRAGSDVSIRLDNGVLHYEVTETFTNTGSVVGEADYLFPLPRGAAFQELKLSINGELVAGETMNADKAREIYESIVRRQRDPALVEWMGYGLLRARIFPINPREQKKVVVRYQTIAQREGDALRIDYFRGTSPDLNTRNAYASLTLTYPADPRFGTPYSPTNDVDPLRDQERGSGPRSDSRFDKRHGTRTVAIRGNARDVTVLLPVRSASTAAITVLPHATGAGDGFAMVTLTPPTIAPRATPRDVTVVIDVSGSMSGLKMDQARAAVKQLLETLTQGDRFRIIDFSSDVRTFRDEYTTATRTNIVAAQRYVDKLEASGSTNIEGALTEALRDQRRDRETNRLPLVLFITDGEPTVGERRPDALASQAARLRGPARVFSFGLGADVNVSFIEQLALQGRGTAQFVRPNESIEDVLSLLARRLTTPIVTDVRVRVQPAQFRSTLPESPSDIFAGQDLVMLTRYRGDGDVHLTFTGNTASGPVTWTTRVNLPARERDNAFVARLWATQRVGYLAAEKRKGGNSAEIDAEIRALGEQYGIPTEFSSYLVQEPGVDRVSSTASPTASAAPGAVRGNGGGNVNRLQVRTEQFEVAKTAAAQRAVLSLSAADSATSVGRARGGAPTKRVGNRLFALRDSVWTDTRTRGNIEIVKVKPFSDAYFSVLAAIPDLAEPFALGARVLAVGRRIAVEVTPEGVAQLSSAAITRMQQQW